MAILLLAVLGGHMLIVRPVITSYSEAMNSLAQKRATLTRLRDVAAAADWIKEQAASTRARQTASGVFLAGSTDALAAAQLQNDVGAVIREAGGDVRSVQSLQPRSESDGLSRIGLRVQFVSNTRTLMRVLYGLETERPFLFVDDLKIRARLERVAPRSSEIAVVEEYLVDLAVSGYRLGGTA